MFALSMLQSPTDLDDAGRDLFHNLLEEVPYYICSKCELFRQNTQEYIKEPITWLMKLLTSMLSDFQIDYQDIQSCFTLLLSFDEKDLNEHEQALEDSFVNAMKCPGHDNNMLGELLMLKSRLRPETIEQLFCLLKEGKAGAAKALGSRAEAILQALEMLQSTTTDQDMAIEIALLIDQSTLRSLPPLEQRQLLNKNDDDDDDDDDNNNNNNNNLEDRLQNFPEKARLQVVNYLGLGNVLPLSSKRAYFHHWKFLSMAEFCENVNLLSEKDVSDILVDNIFFNHYGSWGENEECLWIRDGCIFHETANWSFEYPLEDAKRLQRALRKARLHHEAPSEGIGSERTVVQRCLQTMSVMTYF